jgi:hypothetical protein
MEAHRMRIDLYTKAILTVIALCLLSIGMRLLIQPSPVLAQDGGYVQFAVTGGGLVPNIWFFDRRTGDVWMYGAMVKPTHYRLTALGAPIEGR